MRTFTAFFTLAILAISGAQAQFSDLPTCGGTCAQLSASKATGCVSSDLKCLCQSQDYVNAVYDCLAGACDFGDQSSSVGHLGQICAEAVAAPDTSSTPTTPTSSTSGAPSSSNPGAPVQSTTAPVAFTSTPGTATSTGTGTGAAVTTSTTASVTRGLGTTTVAQGALSTTASQSTTVVVKTVGGDATETASSTGSNILNDNGASGMKASVFTAGIAGVLAVWAML